MSRLPLTHGKASVALHSKGAVLCGALSAWNQAATRLPSSHCDCRAGRGYPQQQLMLRLSWLRTCSCQCSAVRSTSL